MNNKIKVLYLAYDGMTDPLGQSQVLSYLKALSKDRFSFHVISFEKPEIFEKKKASVIDFIGNDDITWHPLPYHKKPPIFSTIYDQYLAWKKMKELYKYHNFQIVHCRGYTLTSLGLKAKTTFGSKFIFDMRGWWPDEKLESGLWASAIYKPVYKYFKQEEKSFFKNCDMAISLTHIGKKTAVELGLKEDNKIKVIPTCVNFDVFKPLDLEIRKEKRKQLGIEDEAIVFLYSGSVGSNYRTDLVLKFFKELQIHNPNSVLVFLSHSDHKIIEAEIEASGVNKEACRILSASYQEVGNNLMVGDVGLIMYNTGFSVIGRSPTKLGEYWASGLLCLSAKGIGDLDALIEQYENSGVLIDCLTEDNDFKIGVQQILNMPKDTQKLRSYAYDYFALEKGYNAYLEIYKSLIE
jgi:glycosyltransferase involved in cell wall biosynthesis